MILFPRYGGDRQVEGIARAELFARLTQGSTNSVALGERGFGALARLVDQAPAAMFAYPDTATALELVAQFWAEVAP